MHSEVRGRSGVMCAACAGIDFMTTHPELPLLLFVHTKYNTKCLYQKKKKGINECCAGSAVVRPCLVQHTLMSGGVDGCAPGVCSLGEACSGSVWGGRHSTVSGTLPTGHVRAHRGSSTKSLLLPQHVRMPIFLKALSARRSLSSALRVWHRESAAPTTRAHVLKAPQVTIERIRIVTVLSAP